MPAAHVAHARGVSRQCAHRWLARFDAEGLAGLHDRTSRPHRSPKRTCAEVEDRVVRHAWRPDGVPIGSVLSSVHKRVIQRAHRVEGPTIPNPREPKFAQEPYEVAFGDSQLNVLTIIRLLPPNQCVGVVVKPICVAANAPNAGTTRVDHALLGQPLEAFVELRSAGNAKVDDIANVADGLPEVETLYTIAGDPDALGFLRVRDVNDLKRVIDLLRQRASVTGTKTLVVLGASASSRG
jgi:hypothetical protein